MFSTLPFFAGLPLLTRCATLAIQSSTVPYVSIVGNRLESIQKTQERRVCSVSSLPDAALPCQATQSLGPQHRPAKAPSHPSHAQRVFSWKAYTKSNGSHAKQGPGSPAGGKGVVDQGHYYRKGNWSTYKKQQDWGSRRQGEEQQRKQAPATTAAVIDPELQQFAAGGSQAAGGFEAEHFYREAEHYYRRNLAGWLLRMRDDLEAARRQPTATTMSNSDYYYSLGRMNSADAISSILQPQQAQGGLRPLGSKQPSHPGGPDSRRQPRFDPKLLPDVIRVFQRASSRLRFSTQLPHAVAAYVAAAAQRGSLDLAAFDVSACKSLAVFLGDAQVVNRDCLEELHKALQSRWSQLPPEDLVELLGALRRLNDADRMAAVGRPGLGSSRLLRMLLDAEPSVMALLGANRSGDGSGSSSSGTHPAAAAGVGGDSAEGAAGSLPPGAAVKLALAYLSFYTAATSGHQHFAMAPMLMGTLELCMARLDPSDPRVTPADDLARLVAGVAGVAVLPSHPLSGHLQRCAEAVTARAGELSQRARAVLLDLPPGQQWALPENWRATLLAAAPTG
ncbi:hypothetical protein Agub_g15181 [Astrephomene gubernaculifera]|uniref:Uncharacterized protein n=1 Tax=Astrephomene gubernaculifera TaxID=47775 RepID=A0AAD3E4P3_9CHLO|nr:hypothetical protein Agub_g15181 [Astrephomene gubernaculifera]